MASFVWIASPLGPQPQIWSAPVLANALRRGDPAILARRDVPDGQLRRPGALSLLAARFPLDGSPAPDQGDDADPGIDPELNDAVFGPGQGERDG